MVTLQPDAFLETLDDCSGPILHRSTQSREAYGPTLNDFMEKYVTADYTEKIISSISRNIKKV